MRVLVVDDNRDAAETLAMLLRLDGHVLQVAHDGAAAIDAVGAFAPEIVFLDLGLPRVDGYEVARRIRSGERGASIMLVAITGWAQDEHRVRSREAGFDHHLTKPVAPETLQELLRRCRPTTAVPVPQRDLL